MRKPTSYLLLFLCCLLAVNVVSGRGLPGPADIRGEQRSYGGLNLSQWHEQLKNIDPKSSRAALVVGPLVEIVADENVPGVDREPFAAFLARIGDRAQKVVPILAAIIDRRHEVPNNDYLWAARALALMGAPAKEAAPALVDLLFDETLPAASRQSPAEALALIGPDHPDAIPALLRLLQHRPSPRTTASQAVFMRQVAAESLFLVGPEADLAAPLLIRLVRDPREPESVRRSALIALGALESRGQIALPVLQEELVAGRSPALRDAAANALIRIGEAALPGTLQYLGHPDAEVRWRVAQQLAQLPVKSIPVVVEHKLRAMQQDEQSIVQINAAETVGKLWGRSDQLAITAMALLGDRDRATRIRAKNLLLTMKPFKEEWLAQLRELKMRGNRYAANSASVVLRQLQRDK